MTYYNSPAVNSWQKQIITGTILGGSSLVKPKKGRNCYLFMRSSNINWLNYKAKEMESLSSERPFTQERNTTRWHSQCFPIFNDFYEMFYQEGIKTVKMEILDSLRNIGLAIWYGDCGKLDKGKVSLNTNKFGEDGTNIISKYFREAGIGESDLTKNSGYIRLVLSDEATENFLLTIAEHLPDFMHQGLLPK